MKDIGDCPICGRFFQSQPIHHCPDSVYNAIDAANARAENGNDRLSDPMLRPLAERLDAGLCEVYGGDVSSREMCRRPALWGSPVR